MRFCIGKRILLGVAVALLLLLSACGGQPASTESPTEFGQDLATQTPEVKAPQETSRKELPAFALQATMEETILVDEKDVKITATALQGTSYQVELSLAIENNSDTDLSFLSGTMGYSCNSVNGYMIDDGYLNVDVVAGKKANETIKFSVDQLELMGITDIADIEIGFHIQTSDYDTYLRTGPRQLRTSLSDSYDYSADTYQEAINNGEFAQIYSYSMEYFATEVPFEKNGVKVLSWGLVTNKDHEKTVFLEVENTSTDQIFLTTSNFYFNGLLVGGYTWSSEAINSEKRKVITLPLSSMLEESYWEIFGLTELGDITFSIGLANPDRQKIAPAEMVSLLLPGVQATFDTAGEEIYNENGLRIISKGLVESNSDYLNDVYVLFLAENGTAETLDIDVAYNSLSVNGYMTDFFGAGQDLAPGKSGILAVSMRGDSLEKNGIDALEKIEDLELSFMIRDDRYNTLAEPKVSFAGRPTKGN